jgi:hypothetical protein
MGGCSTAGTVCEQDMVFIRYFSPLTSVLQIRTKHVLSHHMAAAWVFPAALK